MSIVSSLLGWMTGNSTSRRTGVQTSLPATTPYESAPIIGPDSAMQISVVWACVKLLVETIASMPLFLYKTDSNGKRELLRGTELYSVLHDSPNSQMTAMEFWEYMCMNLVLRGNCFAAIRRNSSGEAYALWPLAADQMEVRLLPDGSIFYGYHIDGKTLIYPESEIFTVRGMGNGIVGLSPLDYMRSSLGLAVSAQNHTAAVYRKQARRAGILMGDKLLTKQQRDALRESFGEIASGGQRELYVLEGGMKFEPIGMTPADLQLLETRKFAIKDLARWLGVPSVLVNDTSDQTSWGTGITQIVEGFYKFTLRPLLVRIEQATQKRVLTASQRAAGWHVEFSFDAILRASLKDRMEIYAQAVQNGIYTRNECRQLENLPAKSGADALTAQVNLVPIDLLGKTGNGGVRDVPKDTIAQ